MSAIRECSICSPLSEFVTPVPYNIDVSIKDTRLGFLVVQLNDSCESFDSVSALIEEPASNRERQDREQ